MHTNRIVDVGPHGLHGSLVNAPTRAVRGSNWTGREQCFRHAPEQYGAIHFHEDDIDDCRWPVTHEYAVPADLRSGAYALMLEAGEATENIPFFVVPPKGKQTAKLAVLVSTFTYTVYGNHARPEWTTNAAWKDAWIKQAKEWNAYPHNPGAHIEYGLSTYNFHTDGSGIAMASWHRPMLNTRIGYFTYPYPDIRGSGLRHYPADSHLLTWLEHQGIAYDLITDWELHHEGLDLLKRYTCVTTGSHPEYHTTEMLDALEAYRDSGGRFMYLGGNGFYWKIALSPDKPGLIEIRRAEGGIRAWAAEPGEYYNQFDGEYGGLWRRNARPPQQLVGVGFTAQGNFVGSHYRVKPEARTSPRTAWMFEGVSDETIGGFGLSGHGAAGFELDRADIKLGTPAHAQVVAQSENHPPEAPWVLVPEEQLTHLTTFPGESHKQLIRADMTLFETPNNGCVFSTGSITFCGSLPHNNFDNNVSTLLRNVLTRFLDPAAKFVVPGSET
jgi:N,N-dimethylformamidase